MHKSPQVEDKTRGEARIRGNSTVLMRGKKWKDEKTTREEGAEKITATNGKTGGGGGGGGNIEMSWEAE